jgi:serine/threonine protein kinase
MATAGNGVVAPGRAAPAVFARGGRLPLFRAVQARQASDVLGGKYRLVRPLGHGGMGAVWHAEHLTLSSPVALKLIEPSTARDQEGLQRFMREARTAAALRSPHVVQILDYGVDGETPYIAMELLEGESLAERLSRLGQLDPPATARIIQHIARAITRAHDANVIHRDLKPENVFIVRNDDEELIKVLDFGIAKSTTAAVGSATRTGALLGTPFYMSPEQAEAVKRLTPRTDIWSLGVVTFQCLLGRHPFTGESLGQLILAICSHPLPVPSELGSVPAGFDAWFARACARDPDERFESAREAAAAFTRLCGETSVASSAVLPRPAPSSDPHLAATTGQATNSELLQKPRAQRGLGRGAVVAAFVLVFVLWSVMRRSSEPPQEATPAAQPPSPGVVAGEPPPPLATGEAAASAPSAPATSGEPTPAAKPASPPLPGNAAVRTQTKQRPPSPSTPAKPKSASPGVDLGI